MEYFRYHSTNCFFIRSKTTGELLAIDAGWSCSLLEYQRGMKSIGLQFKKIKRALVTHFHMDHAGLISEFQREGIECLMFENQQYEHIDSMEKTILKNYKDYKSINKEKMVKMNTKQAKEYFNRRGIELEIIITRGHSEDSISIIQNNEIIIGDLMPVNMIMDGDVKNQESWKKIYRYKIKKIYPSHAGIINCQGKM
jgi:glyoxylase-like metal-dependent hydrolase (beta-lactamase superfamily II)